MEKVCLMLSNEFPRIGSGFRQVEIIKRGYKWVSVRYWPGGPNGFPIRQRIKKDLFKKLEVEDVFSRSTP